MSQVPTFEPDKSEKLEYKLALDIAREEEEKTPHVRTVEGSEVVWSPLDGSQISVLLDYLTFKYFHLGRTRVFKKRVVCT